MPIHIARHPAFGVIFASLLIGLQASVVIAGFFWADPIPAYRATYITHSMDCWLPPGTPAFSPAADVIVPRALSARQACALLPKGWNEVDSTQVWSNGPIAQLEIPLRPGDAQVILHLLGYSQHVPQAVEILQKDAPPLRLQIPPNRIGSIVIAVSPGATMLRLQIKIAHVHRPLDKDLMDWRAIGVALVDITRTPQTQWQDHGSAPSD